MRNNFIEGTKGFFSLIVVANHFMNVFFPYIVGDYEFDDVHKYQNSQSIWRITPLRFLFSGTFAVTMFFVLSGVSLSWKSFDTNFDWESIRNSWLKRYLRLMIPVFLASYFYHIFYKLGIFTYADDAFLDTQSYWLNRYSLTWTAEGCKVFADKNILTIPYFLYETLILIWVYKEPRYCVAFWPLSLFLFGSFVTYGVLIVVSSIKLSFSRYFLYTLIIIGILQPNWNGVYRYNIMDAMNNSCIPFFVLGIFLTDVYKKFIYQEAKNLRKIITMNTVGILLFLFGIFMGAYPYFISEKVFPKTWAFLRENYYIRNTGYIYPFFIGCTAFSLGLFLSGLLQKVFSNKFFVFLGKISYELYIIHNLVIFSFTAALIGKIPNIANFFLSVLVILGLSACCNIGFTKVTEKIVNFFSDILLEAKLPEIKVRNKKIYVCALLMLIAIIFCYIPPFRSSERCLMNITEKLLTKNNGKLMHGYFTSEKGANFFLLPDSENQVQLYQHFYCENRHIISREKYFNYSLVEDWNNNCTSYTKIFANILTENVTDISLLFLAHDFSKSNLKLLYSHVLWYKNYIQDQVINFNKDFNSAYTTTILGHTWVEPLPGGTPRPCEHSERIYCT